MTIAEAVGLAGLLFGLSGFVLGVMNYLRDRHRVVVRLHWDMAVPEGRCYDTSKTWGVVSIANVGRRPAYLSHVALRLPDKNRFLVLEESIVGVRLAEGDPPKAYIVNQDELKDYSQHWKKITAQVEDTTGKRWISNKISKQPSWARTHEAAAKQAA